MWDVIVLVPDHCLSFHFVHLYLNLIGFCFIFMQNHMLKSFTNDLKNYNIPSYKNCL